MERHQPISYEQTNLGSGRGAKKFEEAIQKYHVDGIIYFNWTDNIGTPVDYAQVNALSNGIQKVVYNFIKAILYYQQIVKQIFVLYNIVNG
jgi:hypothetical protein